MTNTQIPLEAVVNKLATKLTSAEIRIASLESYIDMLEQEIANSVPVQEAPEVPPAQHVHEGVPQ